MLLHDKCSPLSSTTLKPSAQSSSHALRNAAGRKYARKLLLFGFQLLEEPRRYLEAWTANAFGKVFSVLGDGVPDRDVRATWLAGVMSTQKNGSEEGPFFSARRAGVDTSHFISTPSGRVRSPGTSSVRITARCLQTCD